MRTKFEKTVDGDAVFYWYDITQYIQSIIGEVVSKALVCVGHIYRDDSEYEIERAENIFESTVREINRKLENSSESEVQSNEHGRVEGISVIEEMNFGGAYFCV